MFKLYFGFDRKDDTTRLQHVPGLITMNSRAYLIEGGGLGINWRIVVYMTTGYP